MGGIGEVSTNPQYRGRGLATDLLQLAIEYCKGLKFPIMQLHTSKQTGFYANLGWIDVPTPRRVMNYHLSSDEAHKRSLE